MITSRRPPPPTEWLRGWVENSKSIPGQGHWLIEHDGETIVRDIHRWIIQKLGEKILLAEFS